MAAPKRLPVDPIAEAKRQWIAHGWEGAAAGMTVVTSIIRAQLPYPLDRLLDEHAPPRITVPSGQSHKLDYSNPSAPVLAVRLQEIFGLTETPRLAGGRVPLLLHLLGPNFRPVQITNDLKSFWATTYFQVRKDLRVRYPKHSWPEDPLTAVAIGTGRTLDELPLLKEIAIRS